MKRIFLWLLLCLLLWPYTAGAEQVAFFEDGEADTVGRIVRTYDSPTLKYQMEKFKMEGEICYLTRIWVQDPARQIRKATSNWKEDVQYPDKIVKQIPETVLAVNGSGFVSPLYPEIPDNYPGVGVPYYGLTLDADGLQMYIEADNETVLATEPSQTWSFYTECPMLLDNTDILPEDWKFADRLAARTCIGRINRNEYLILTATKERGKGISLHRAVSFFQDNFRTEWVYNLDGGNSTALLCRKTGQKKLRLALDRGAKIVDIMAFTE